MSEQVEALDELVKLVTGTAGVPPAPRAEREQSYADRFAEQQRIASSSNRLTQVSSTR